MKHNRKHKADARRKTKPGTPVQKRVRSQATADTRESFVGIEGAAVLPSAAHEPCLIPLMRFGRGALLSVLVLLSFLASCGEDGAKARNEIKDAVDASSDWMKGRWESWQKDLSEFDATVAQWKQSTSEKLSSASDAVREKWSTTTSSLDEQRQKLAKELSEAKEKGKDAFEAAEVNLKASWERLKAAYAAAKLEFTKNE
jgi:gas vesicle protein